MRLAVVGDSILVDDDRWLPAALEAQTGRFTLPDGFNRAVGGATTQVVLDRIGEALALSPDVLILHAGTNDLVTTLDPADAIYERIATACARGLAGGIGHVLVGCVLPRQDAYWQRCRMRYPERERLNERLRRLPGDPRIAPYPGRVGVVDLERRFDPGRDTLDGLHPNAAGGHRLGRAIGRHLARIAARRGAGPDPVGRLRALATALGYRVRLMRRRASPASAAPRRS